MNNSKSIITIKEYGRINICLKKLIESRNISRNYLAKAANTRFEVIDKWYNDNVEKLDLDVLARICYVLDCSPDEIIKYNREYTFQ